MKLNKKKKYLKIIYEKIWLLRKILNQREIIIIKINKYDSCY